MKSFLFFCTGECPDALRDRDFYLVAAEDEVSARARLTAWFAIDGSNDSADNYSVFVKGENLSEGLTGVHHCFRMQTID